ncbi:MAG: HAD family phosphatase [Succinivibrio sp.]|nr:HAD family phosphatase [Succinivibrio sp.]
MSRYTLESLQNHAKGYRLLALDLDGTLLTSEKKISPRTLRVLKQAIDKGFAIVLTTGRHPRSALLYSEQLSPITEKSYAVCFNGSAVISLQKFKEKPADAGFSCLSANLAGGDMIADLASYVHSMGCKVHGYSRERGLVIEDMNPQSKREVCHSGCGYQQIDFSSCTSAEGFFKLIAVGQSQKIDALRTSLPQRFLDYFSVLRTDPDFLEFIPERSTKGTALASLCDLIGIGLDRTVAFGDAENDLEMIKLAGLGVAMGNAQQQQLKDEADVVTLSNDEDGVAAVVERLM